MNDKKPLLNGTKCANNYNACNGETVKLKKQLGLFSAVCFIGGKIIGSGIFVSPKGVLQESGSLGSALLVWFASGILSTIGALCYAELGTSVPKSGGEYAYIREGFGNFLSFLFLWVFMIVIMPATNTVAALTFANYILQPLYPHCSPDENALRLLAATLILILVAVNCYNVKLVTKVQNVFTFTKVFAIFVIVAVGVTQLIKGDNSKFGVQNAFKGSSTSPGHIALAFYSGIFSFGGWNYLNFITEELKDPSKNLPRAIFISLPLTTFIYICANVAYFATLTSQEILDSDAVAVLFGDKTLGAMSISMPISVAFSTIAGLNAGIFASSRLLFVGARVGHLPSLFATVNIKYFTPITSIVFIGFVSLCYLSTTKIFDLINYTAFNEALFAAISIASMLKLRRTQPDIHRPIKVNLLLPIIFLLVSAFLIILPFYVKPKETCIGFAFTLSGIPFYFLVNCQPKFLSPFTNWLNECCQKLFYCVGSVDEKEKL